MNILVCMKAVPSTSQVQVDGQFKLRRDRAKLEWNIADQAALEAALQLQKPGDSITVITMGPAKLEENMREIIARGADRAILVTDPGFAGSDTHATVNVLHAAIKKLETFDLILCGRRAIDGETGQVPPMLASSFDLPSITNVSSLSCTDNTLSIVRQLDNGAQTLSTPLPALISVSEYSYSLRLPSITGMRKAKSKIVEILNLAKIGIKHTDCGIKGSLTKVINMEAKFPGLRKGPKETNIELGVSTTISLIREVPQ